MGVDPSELFRFRIVRNFQAQQLQGGAVDLSNVASSAPTPSKRDNVTTDPATWKHWLSQLSTTLALRGDYVEPAAVIKLLPQDWTAQIAGPAWQELAASLAQTLVLATRAAAQSDAVQQVAAVEGLARLLRVYDLVVTL